MVRHGELAGGEHDADHVPDVQRTAARDGPVLVDGAMAPQARLRVARLVLRPGQLVSEVVRFEL